jgi:hypothetical protein
VEILTTASSTKNVTNTTSVTGRKTTKRRESMTGNVNLLLATKKRRESMTGNVNLLPLLVPTTARRTKRRNTTGNVNLLHPLPLALSTSSARSPEKRSAETIAVIADTIASILGQKSCSVKKKESDWFGLLLLITDALFQYNEASSMSYSSQKSLHLLMNRHG